jgi:hypothetical protein
MPIPPEADWYGEIATYIFQNNSQTDENQEEKSDEFPRFLV